MTKTEINKLDALWRGKVKENAGYKCEVGGKKSNQCQLHCHHYYGRRNRATRWYIPNGVCLSAKEHKLGVHSAHENPEMFRFVMLMLRGEDWMKDLTRQSVKIFKGTYQQVKDYLDGKTKNYVN